MSSYYADFQQRKKIELGAILIYCLAQTRFFFPPVLYQNKPSNVYWGQGKDGEWKLKAGTWHLEDCSIYNSLMSFKKL